MYKEIVLKQADGQEKTYGFLATSATAIRYRQLFHEDLMLTMNKLETSDGEPAPDADLTFADKLAYVMNAAAEKKDVSTLTYDSFIEWLEEIDSGELIAHMQELILLYAGNKVTRSQLKKSQGKLRGK